MRSQYVVGVMVGSLLYRYISFYTMSYVQATVVLCLYPVLLNLNKGTMGINYFYLFF
jgi:hypothetical protein